MPPQLVAAQPPTHCPHLGTETLDRQPSAPLNYPSFENRCWSADQPVAILLTDQATQCLCSGYRYCPRFLAARAARQGAPSPINARNTATSPLVDALSQELEELEADVEFATVRKRQTRTRWGWIGAGLIFISSLLCGGFFAAYIGWQMVSNEWATSPPGTVDTLAAPAAPAQPQVYLIVTATSEPPPLAPATPAAPGNNSVAVGAAPAYPAAVTPTPTPPGAILVLPPTTALPSLPDPAQAAPLAESQIAPPQAAAPPAGFNVQLEVPTRRPTPILDIPTSTPAPAISEPAPPTATFTPIPPQGTPFVIFAAAEPILDPGECTILTWHVENVRAVYFESQGVDGRGSREVCVDNDKNDYDLMVVLADGTPRTYTVSVDVLLPTPIPTPTPTWTDVPAPTPTWTPLPPTATPTPNVRYGVSLAADGNPAISCRADSVCEADLYVTNSGDTLDNISVYVSQTGAWSYQICRLDGVCAHDRLTLINMGAGNTGVVRVRVTIPADAQAAAQTYAFRAVSEHSNGGATSDTVTLDYAVP
jgi:hypothetical protein